VNWDPSIPKDGLEGGGRSVFALATISDGTSLLMRVLAVQSPSFNREKSGSIKTIEPDISVQASNRYVHAPAFRTGGN
jgi:hypothetical protein